MPKVILKPASKIVYPGVSMPAVDNIIRTDCHSPGFWDGDTLFIFNSWEHPHRTFGPSIEQLGPTVPVKFDIKQNGGQWLEGIWRMPNGKIYGWYHLEPNDMLRPGSLMHRYPTKPKVAAIVSEDNGLTWKDMGFILSGPDDLVDLNTKDTWYYGGEGDFGSCVDKDEKYIYFIITTFYGGGPQNQGLACARMEMKHLDNPVGNVWKWRNNKWEEPGLGGFAEPFIPVTRDWHDAKANAFWGPAIHWNSYLNSYAMFINRVDDGTWHTEGYYVSFNPDISNPNGWSTPEKVLEGAEAIAATAPNGSKTGWYVSVFPTAKGENDNRITHKARLFATGTSNWELNFEK